MEQDNFLERIKGVTSKGGIDTKTKENLAEESVEKPAEEPVEKPVQEEPAQESEEPKDSEGEVKEEPKESEDGVRIGEKEQEDEGVKEEVVDNTEEYTKQIDDLKSQLDAEREKREEYERLLQESQDPMSYFADESEYKKQQLLKNNPTINRNAIDKVFESDIDKLDPLDAIATQWYLESPELSYDEAKEAVKEQYNIDEEGTIKPLVKKAAGDARRSLKGFRDQEIQAPKDGKSFVEGRQKEREEQIEKTKENFQPIVDSYVKEWEGVEFKNKEGTWLKYDFSPEDKEDVQEVMLEVLAETGASLDDAENQISAVRTAIEKEYIYDNLERILKAHVDEAVHKKDEEWRKLSHNPKETNQQKAPEHKDDKNTTPERAKGLFKR